MEITNQAPLGDIPQEREPGHGEPESTLASRLDVGTAGETSLTATGESHRPSVTALRAKAEQRLLQYLAEDADPRPPEVLIHELQVHQVELEMQHEELQLAHAALAESRDRYRRLYEFSPVGYVTLSDQGLVAEANLVAAELMGVTRQQLTQQPLTRYMSPEAADEWHVYCRATWKSKCPRVCDLSLRRADGMPLPARITAVRAPSGREPPMLNVAILDITAEKRAKEAWQDVRHHLEQELAESLAAAQESGVALKALFRQQHSEKDDAQRQLRVLLDGTVMPFLHKLEASGLPPKQAFLLNMAVMNLQQALDAFGAGHDQVAAFQKLTPTEIQVATMVRQGLTSKVIAVALSLSAQTISVHRKHIRKKLGLMDTANLRSHLLSLQSLS